MRSADHRTAGTSRLRGTGVVAVLVVLLMLLTGCSIIPSSGTVGTIPAAQEDTAAMGPVFTPEGPVLGASPESILRSFITAGIGASDGYSVARQFLTPELGLTWQPEERIILFGADPRVEQRDGEGTYQIQLETTGTIDTRGVRTDSTVPATETLDVELVQVNGEWRIDEIPDGIMLAQSSARDLLISHSLYFYSSNYRYWVPDARWFVRRTGVTARIIGAMLAGPAPYLQGAVTSAFPEGVSLARDSVPITSGRASVDLSPEVLDNATSLRLQQMNQQLQINLLGLNDVTTVEMTSGQPIDLGTVSPELVVPERTPDVGGDQVAVSDGELVRVHNNSVERIDGLPSVAALGPRKPATSGSGSAYGFLDADRTSLFITAPGSEARPIVTGGTLTQPSFDPENWVWTARTREGRSEVLAVPPGGSEDDAVVLTAGWLADRTIKELRVSRDGARALVVTDGDGDGTGEVLLAGVTRSAEGAPQTLSTPLSMMTGSPVDTAKWAGQSTVLVSSTGVGEPATPTVLQLNGQSDVMAELEGVTHISAGSDAENTVYAQAGGTLHKRIGSSWLDQELDVLDPAFPG